MASGRLPACSDRRAWYSPRQVVLVRRGPGTQLLEGGLGLREIAFREQGEAARPIQVRRVDALQTRVVERRQGGVGLIVSRQEQDQAAVRTGATRVEADGLPELGDAFLELLECVVRHRELIAELRVVGVNLRERPQAVTGVLELPVDGEVLGRDEDTSRDRGHDP